MSSRAVNPWSLGAMALLVAGLLAMHGFWGGEPGAAHHASPSSPTLLSSPTLFFEEHAGSSPGPDGGPEAHQVLRATSTEGVGSNGEILLTCLLALTGIVTLLAAHRSRAPVGWLERLTSAVVPQVREVGCARWCAGCDLGTALCVMRV